MSRMLVCTQWSAASEYDRGRLVGLFEAQVRLRLGVGVHEFGELSELFARLGFVHSQEASLELLLVGPSRGSVMRMSYSTMVRIIHLCSGIRLVQNSWVKVEREGVSRLVLIVL